jgi:hypothetical protein
MPQQSITVEWGGELQDEQLVELPVGHLGDCSARGPKPGDSLVCPACGQEHNMVEWRSGGFNRSPELWIECSELAKRQGLARPFVRVAYKTSLGNWRLISGYELVKYVGSDLPGSSPRQPGSVSPSSAQGG